MRISFLVEFSYFHQYCINYYIKNVINVHSKNNHKYTQENKHSYIYAENETEKTHPYMFLVNILFLGILNGRNPDKTSDNGHGNDASDLADDAMKCYRTVLLSPGKMVSASYLLLKNKFRKVSMNDLTGAPLAKEVFDQLEEKKFGKQRKFTVKQNKSVVSSVPKTQNDFLTFSRLLAAK